jgi:hypothetical protein
MRLRRRGTRSSEPPGSRIQQAPSVDFGAIRADRAASSPLPMIGAQLGLDLSVVSQSIAAVTNAVIAIILRITGHV